MKYLFSILFFVSAATLSAQTIFLQQADYMAPPAHHEWIVTVVTQDGLIENLFSGTIESAGLILSDLDTDMKEYVFTHFIDGFRVEEFVYDCQDNEISPSATKYIVASVVE